ncbi:MAG: protease modulator HflC [Thermodesulfobacteriota bacterium]
MLGKNGPVVLILALLLLALYSAFFIVDQTETALVLQLGEPLGEPLGPGLHLKVPFLQRVVVCDSRLLAYETPPVEMLTADQNSLIVSAFAKWKVLDQLKYYLNVRDPAGARSRLENIVLSELRSELGRRPLIEVITASRADVLGPVVARADAAAREYGLGVTDVRIFRLNLPRENEQSVFAQMRAERQGQVRKYRAEGQEESRKIRAAAERERTVLLAEAYRKAQEIKGQGDAQAARIYAEALGQDPDFYDFVRTLELYRTTVDERTTLFLSRDDELMRLMKDSGPRPPAE